MHDSHSLRATPRATPSPAPRCLNTMLDDAWLDEGIAPRSHHDDSLQPVGLRDARRILLTGGTGFLGRSVAKELLDSSPASLLCLVRQRAGAGVERLRASLEAAGVSARTIDQRVQIVSGDLSKSRFGLSDHAFFTLGEAVDAICHVGAVVHWTLPYASLRASNVESTRDLIELACRTGVPLHFVSSLSVCYSTAAPRSPVVIDDSYDPLPHLAGLHLGYAQSKVVAEVLVREAGRRGLQVSIYRPSLLAGHSVTGDFNSGDIVARVISGCIRMGVAPDLDWDLDCVPVDTAARLIVDRSSERGVHHINHNRPRSWRECVLWMRLSGYDVRLVPLHAWLHRLERDTADGDREHPLRALRGFFLNRHPHYAGRTQLELLIGADLLFLRHENERVPIPALDAELMDRYFGAFVAAEVIPSTARVRAATQPPVCFDRAFFSEAMGTKVESAELVERLSEHSILSDLTSWRAGQATGLFRCRLSINGVDRSVIVKAKAPDRDAIAVGDALGRLIDNRLGELVSEWAPDLGTARAGARELAIYSQRDPRFKRHTPALLGSRPAVQGARGSAGEPRSPVGTDGLTYLVLEDLQDVHLKDTASAPQLWQPSDIACAIDGAATLQAIWLGRDNELASKPWIGPVASTARRVAMSELWHALAAHAAPRFSAWARPAMATTHRRLVESVGEWAPTLDALPRTLIHHDFNPRNICFRHQAGVPALVAYDWELATVGVPQRDLAELLCFVLPEDAGRDQIEAWIERHRRRLQDEAGVTLDADDWKLGFAASMFDLLLSRLPIYAIVRRVRRQEFLPRVVRNWWRIYSSVTADSL